MFKLLMVGLGGFAGSICRFAAYETANLIFKEQWLPYATLFVNLLGCLIIGWLGGLSETRHVFTPDLRALIFVGFLGGFTTFSTFGLDIFTLLAQGRFIPALTSVGLHLIVGLAAVWLGFSMAVS